MYTVVIVHVGGEQLSKSVTGRVSCNFKYGSQSKPLRETCEQKLEGVEGNNVDI